MIEHSVQTKRLLPHSQLIKRVAFSFKLRFLLSNYSFYIKLDYVNKKYIYIQSCAHQAQNFNFGPFLSQAS